MRRILLAAAALALAASAASARADTFAIAPASLPSAAFPNDTATLLLPAQLTTRPAQPVQLSAQQLQGLWEQAGAAYGVPWQVLAAINKVESNFGRNMGPSSAGAIGWMQFMPSTWLRWGIDANGDGVANPWNPVDAVYSAARYLAAAGAATDLPRAIYSYNHAQWYVNEVLQLASLYQQTSGGATFALDTLQQRLSAAETNLVQASGAYVAAAQRERELSRRRGALLAKAGSAPSLTARLDLQRQAARVGFELAGARGDVLRQRQARQQAARALADARASAQAASFAPAARPLLASPTQDQGYVFPVGGGPGVVSVGPGHHDYPAADIAAPAGSPVYALAQAVVTRAWSFPSGTCGIGLTMRAADGLVWTYCHLAYLDANVLPGAILQAGEPVGLVGATGDATGPHLHLQLQPANAYPQDMPWFQRFAGTAFSWQGGSQPAGSGTVIGEPVSAGPVFSVVASATAPSPPPTGQVILFDRPVTR